MNTLPTTPPAFDINEHIRSIVLDRESGVALHAQLRSSLRRIIQATPPQVEKLTPENSMTEILGVSQVTVRKALDGLVEEGLIERKRAIGTVIKRRSDKSVQPTQIAVIVPDYPSVAIQSHMGALNAQAGANNIRLTLIALARGENWHSCKHQISFSAAEGGVILLNNSPQTTFDLYAHLHEQGYATVAIGAPLDNCPCNTVSIDNRAFVQSGLERLAANGHRRIAFVVGEPEEFPETQERIRHFEELSGLMGLSEAEVIRCGTHDWENSSEASAHAVANRCKLASPPTAYFGISDVCAAGTLFGLNKAGLQVPQDASILSYDGTELTRIVQPKLTTLVTPMNTFAKTVISMLTPGLKQDQCLLVKPEFRDGNSILPLN